jgi:hypothetical protein
MRWLRERVTPRNDSQITSPVITAPRIAGQSALIRDASDTMSLTLCREASTTSQRNPSSVCNLNINVRKAVGSYELAS